MPNRRPGAVAYRPNLLVSTYVPKYLTNQQKIQRSLQEETASSLNQSSLLTAEYDMPWDVALRPRNLTGWFDMAIGTPRETCMMILSTLQNMAQELSDLGWTGETLRMLRKSWTLQTIEGKYRQWSHPMRKRWTPCITSGNLYRQIRQIRHDRWWTGG